MTVDITLGPAPVTLAASSIIVDVAPAPTGTDPGVWAAYVRDENGTQYAALDPEPGTRIDETLNEWARTSVGIRKNDADLAHCVPWERELHLERNGRLMYAGPFTGGPDVEKGSGVRRCPSQDLRVWFEHLVRIIDEGVEFNFFKNPDFETGDTGSWVQSGSVTMDGDSETGSWSAAFNSTGDRLSQVVVFSAFHFDFTLSVGARIKVSSDVPTTEFITVECRSASATQGYSIGYIPADLPRDVWTDMPPVLVQADGTNTPSLTFTITYKGPSAGEILIDTAECTIVNLRELLAENQDVTLPETAPVPIDVGKIIANTVHAVNSNLNLGVRATNVGRLALEGAAQPTLAWETIKGAADAGGCDNRLELSRYVRTLVLDAPRSGRDIPEEELTLTPHGDPTEAGHVADYRLPLDATKVRNDLFVVSSDGTFGRARSVPDGGKVLQAVIGAPSGVGPDVGALNSYAASALIEEAPLTRVLTLFGLRGSLLDTVKLGDRVHVVIDDEEQSIDEPWRVVARSIDVDSDTWDCTLNPEPA